MKITAKEKRICEKKEKCHDELVEKVVGDPEFLGIKGLTLETLVAEPLSFPELRKPGQETGDLILIWSSGDKEWEILILEFTTSRHRSFEVDSSRLEMTENHLIKNWIEEFSKIGLVLPGNHALWIRGASASWANGILWEPPLITPRKRRRIK